jgi:acyl-CoA dehydrogenase
MDFSPSGLAAELTEAVRAFIADEITPVERDLEARAAHARRTGGAPGWQVPAAVRELRERARGQGLWNLFLPAGHEGPYARRYGTRGGAGLSNVDYAPIAEATGWSFLAPYVFNCNAPDTGNMEVLLRYGSAEQRDRWLDPLLDGSIRSGFAMTEPGVASSDATNMQLTAVLDGDEVVLDGRKWWTTGIGHPDCRVLIVMGLTDPEADRHARHSMVLVPIDTPG